MSAPATPIATPIGNVSASTPAIPGAPARATPKTAIAPRHRPIASRVPERLESRLAGGANKPMQRTGIVASSPATACETPRSSSISGMQRPDADQLRPQRERAQEQSGEQRQAGTPAVPLCRLRQALAPG